MTWTDSHCISDAAVAKLQQFRIQRQVYSDFLNSCVQSDFQENGLGKGGQMLEGFGMEGIWEPQGEVDEQVETYYYKT